MSSDLAWAFWRRASSNLLKIWIIASLTVVNSETEKIIDRALKESQLNEVPVWPGVDYTYNTDSYLAILGTFCLFLPYTYTCRALRISFLTRN